MSDYLTCPVCIEPVHKYASKCPHCHTDLLPESPPQETALGTLIGITLGIGGMFLGFWALLRVFRWMFGL